MDPLALLLANGDAKEQEGSPQPKLLVGSCAPIFAASSPQNQPRVRAASPHRKPEDSWGIRSPPSPLGTADVRSPVLAMEVKEKEAIPSFSPASGGRVSNLEP